MIPKPWHSLLILLTLLSSAEFVLRGPARFPKSVGYNDFISPYIQSRALIEHLDPYNPAALFKLWPTNDPPPEYLAKELAAGTLVSNRGIPTAYPLTCLILLAPVALLPWPLAAYVWEFVSLSLILIMIGMLYKTVAFRSFDLALGFVIFSLALAPLHTGLTTGTVTIIAVALCGIAWSATERKNNWIAGLLLGLGICLKPQVGLPFLACYVLCRRWRMSSVAVAVVLAITGIAVLWLAVHGTPWIKSYQADNKALLDSGIFGDFTERDPMRFGLINMQVLAYAVLNDRSEANVVAFATFIGLAGVWAFLELRNRSHDFLLIVSTISVLSLLPIYHRLYDATILIFPIAWAMREAMGGKKRSARAALFLILPFLIPGGAALEALRASNIISPAISHSWYWNALVMPHEIWCLLILSLLLLSSMRSTGHGAV